MTTTIQNPLNSCLDLHGEYIISTSISDAGVLNTGDVIEETNTELPFITHSSSAESENDRVVPIVNHDDLIAILQQFEKKYHMRSKEFHESWLAKNAPNTIDTMKWVVLWELYREYYMI